MRIIKVLRGSRIEAFDAPTEEMTPQKYDDIMKPADENKSCVLGAAGDIEQLLETIIANYFFGHGQENRNRRREFTELLLQSDWFTLNNKRKVVTYIINETGVIEGCDKNEYEKLLKNVISYRNAFTHGEMSTDGRRVCLRYFEGAPQEKFLDDEYLFKVEKDINDCFKRTFKMAISLANMGYRKLPSEA